MEAKVFLVGPQGVGKTSIATKLDETTVSSQRNDATTTFANCDVLVGQSNIQLQISDISGEEKLRSMGPIYYKGAKAALCVFDLTSEKSLQALRPWISSVRNYASDDCKLIVIGNKSDIENRQVSQLYARKYAETLGAKYFETSAVTGKGLLNLVIYIAKTLTLWNDCYNNYAAKRSIISNYIEYKSPPEKEKKLMRRRFSFPVRKLSLMNIGDETKN